MQREGSEGTGDPADLNDFRPGGRAPAGEAGGKIFNDFINNFPPAGRPAQKPNVTTTTPPPTTGLYLPFLL